LAIDLLCDLPLHIGACILLEVVVPEFDALDAVLALAVDLLEGAVFGQQLRF
jgi:hypothetical protein